MKKRALSLLLALTMLCTSAVNVFAGNTRIEFDQKVYTVDNKKGETFEVSVLVSENQGFNTMQGFIKYDPEVIEAVEAVDKDDVITFNSGRLDKPFFATNVIDGQINMVPGSTNPEYEGKADNRKTAGEVGIIKVAAIVDAFDENLRLKVIEDTGSLFTIKFKVVGEGTSNIEFEDVSLSITGETVEGWTENVAPATVIVGGSSSNENTTAETTAATTEVTTKALNTGSNGGGNVGGVTTQTTTSETTEETTEATTEEATEVTTDEVVKFNDIQAYPWAEAYINDLASRKIINGYADGSFKPADNVKRADFIIMVINAIGADKGQEITENFDDVSEGAYYYRAVGIAKELGIANGNGDGTFAPTSYITRQDMMIIAKKSLEIVKGSEITGNVDVLDKFADKNEISAYAVESLAAMVENSVVNGTGNNIEPKSNTTRAQAAVIISKALAMLG